MKLVIEIDDEWYETLKKFEKYTESLTDSDIAVLNGIPLPKNHGRLIDADSVNQIIKPIEDGDNSWAMTGETAKRLIYDTFKKAPTIIEADKE